MSGKTERRLKAFDESADSPSVQKHKKPTC